ncbi:cupin domain-containing protein [Arthrobacter sp. B0490]|uniref:cupin domain-containing protein n=1 Tax=Arthrobacter sp. B0490 TaxID=2058891 RepID=UPI0011AFFDBC|nr:cupin domain-containing protein [Arthrobacter sp. B0490]
MTFPDPKDFRLVVAGPNQNGEPDFLEVGPAVEFDFPGVSAGAFYWAVEDGHSATNFGGPPRQLALAGPNGSTFGISSFPAHSSGTAPAEEIGDSMTVTGDEEDGMHASETIDYEVVISGKVDVQLPGGKTRTLVPGDLLVMAGVPHAWKNPYDEICVYIVVTVGYNKTGAN